MVSIVVALVTGIWVGSGIAAAFATLLGLWWRLSHHSALESSYTDGVEHGYEQAKLEAAVEGSLAKVILN